METIASFSKRLEVVNDGDKASKKLMGENELPFNDDLLIEILLRLPVFSLLLFKSVSKHWLSLITNPNFISSRSKIANLDSPSGLFLLFGYVLAPLDFRIPARSSPFNTLFTFPFDSYAGNVEILHSYNGLLLCGIRPDKFYEYNPSINKFKMLPYVHCSKFVKYTSGVKMACDPTKSPHYKVVYAGVRNDSHVSSIQIHSYSSETDNWNVCGDRFSYECFKGFCNGIYWNDAIHWLDVVDERLHFKLSLEPPSLTHIQIPRALFEKVHYDHKLFESRGCLLLCSIVYIDNSNPQQLNVYEMRNGYSSWSMKYLVVRDNIMMLNPETWKMSAKWFCFNVLCIVVGEREEDSFLVMEAFGKVVKYKIMRKILYQLYDLESSWPPVMVPSSLRRFPFIASFAGV